VRNTLAFAVAIGFFVALVGGCAATDVGGSSTKSKSTEVRVRERAESRWAALLKGDIDKAYQFLSPTARETMSSATYRGKVNPKVWRGATVDSVVCEKEICDVKITIKIEVLDKLPVSVPGVAETWILDQSEWWLVFTG
jgi:hypothetical protein